jgi:hypothetical protein
MRCDECTMHPQLSQSTPCRYDAWQRSNE